MKNYFTPLSPKQKSIQAFTRLLDLARQKRYRGRKLDDRKVSALHHAVFTWLNLSGFNCKKEDNAVTVQFDDGVFRIVVKGTHSTYKNFPPNQFTDENTLQVYSFLRFLEWYESEFEK